MGLYVVVVAGDVEVVVGVGGVEPAVKREVVTLNKENILKKL